LAPAELFRFRRVDPMNADALAVDLDAVAVRDYGEAGDVGKGGRG
jgi:hypothetical protein